MQSRTISGGMYEHSPTGPYPVMVNHGETLCLTPWNDQTDSNLRSFLQHRQIKRNKEIKKEVELAKPQVQSALLAGDCYSTPKSPN